MFRTIFPLLTTSDLATALAFSIPTETSF